MTEIRAPFPSVPELEDAVSVLLVPIVPEEDAPTIHELINEDREHMATYDLGYTDYSTVEAVQKFLESGLYDYAFGIMAGDQMVGNVYLTGVEVPEFTNVAYWVGKSFAGKGIGTEAVRQAVDFAFNSLNKHAVLAHTVANNNPSIALLKRLGFGLFEKRKLVIDKDPVEIQFFGLVNPKYAQEIAEQA